MGTTRIHHAGRFLALAETRDWEYVTRTNASGVAVLVAVTPESELVLVEQYRVPVQSQVIELPAGLAGDGEHQGEDVARAALRELEEETGFRASGVTELLSCPSTSGMSDEIITFFLAHDLVRVGAGGGDASEDIRVHCVPLNEADEWLVRQRDAGRLLDPKVYTALYWLRCPGTLDLIAPAATGSSGSSPAA